MRIKTSATYYINNDDTNVIKVFEGYIKFVTKQTENIKIAERQEKKNRNKMQTCMNRIEQNNDYTRIVREIQFRSSIRYKILPLVNSFLLMF